ncbi:hypothetical protein [Humidisolicoccus flavus]|uniref:hypothetical protein n=1 Tax=Humidisolicoccus flavus TaxID=3111414 RepID=UPI0032500D5E
MRKSPFLLLSLVSVVGLSACTPGILDTSDETANPNPSTSVPAPSSSEGEPSSEPTPSEDVVIPVPQDCESVFSLQNFYDVNPNFALADAPSTLPASFDPITEYGGTVCTAEHTTSGDVLIIGVAALTQEQRSEIEFGFTDTGAFTTEGDIGSLSEIRGDSLIVVASQYFASEEDAAPIVGTVAANID